MQTSIIIQIDVEEMDAFMNQMTTPMIAKELTESIMDYFQSKNIGFDLNVNCDTSQEFS